MIDIDTMRADDRAIVLRDLLEGISRAVAEVISKQRPRFDAAGLGMIALDLRRDIDEVLADVEAVAME